MSEPVFFVFGLGFFLFACYLCIADNRHSQDRRDRRADIDYHRMLSERREFGYSSNEEHIRPRKRRFLNL